MFSITESNHAQLERFNFIQSALLIYKMLTYKGECSHQREQILHRKKSHVFLFIHKLLIVSKKGVEVFCCTLSCNEPVSQSIF